MCIRDRCVPFGQVGIYLVFGKGGIDMFLAVIVELAYSHLRHFMLPCVKMCIRDSCNPCCPGRDALINTINQLMVEIKDTEPECFQRLMLELQNIKNPYNNCVLPCQFGAVNAVISILKHKYIDAKKGKRKIFISHSHSDKTIVEGFVKDILKVGCGFKDNDLFCTLDTSSIRTGDDFREKIVENMSCLLYTSRCV